MRTLHVASSYPLTDGDTTAPFMQEMLSALAERGHEVKMLVPRIVGLEEGHRRGVEVVGFRHAPASLQHWGYGRSVVRGGHLRRSVTIVAPMAMTAMALSVIRILRSWEPDIVHLHWLVPQGLLAPLVGRSTPVVISIHGADVGFALGRLRHIARYALRRADAIVAASSAILDSVATLDPATRHRIHSIPHGADHSRFGTGSRSEARSVLGLGESDRIAFAVGRLVRKKGFDVLIRASRHAEMDGVRFFIAGNGPEAEPLKDLVAEIRAPVAFLGQLSRDDVAAWLAAADVIAVPSRQSSRDMDSGPVVLMESLASGTPVVTTPVGMAPDAIVPGVNGALVPQDDPDALAQAIASVLARSAELGANARRRFLEIGDWRRVALQLERVYEGVLAGQE